MTPRNVQSALVQMNVRWLSQALEMLKGLDHRRFTTAPKAQPPQRVSSHLRHIIEFYECFLEGLRPAHIDYDARPRDLTLEASIGVAAERIRGVITRLESESALQYDSVLFVRMEDAVDLDDPFLMSSVPRELMALSSHTIHHFALIAVTLRGHGMAVDPEFGVAPSTLRYHDQKRRAEAA